MKKSFKYVGLVIDEWNFENENKIYLLGLAIEAKAKAVPSKLRESLNGNK